MFFVRTKFAVRRSRVSTVVDKLVDSESNQFIGRNKTKRHKHNIREEEDNI